MHRCLSIFDGMNKHKTLTAMLAVQEKEVACLFLPEV